MDKTRMKNVKKEEGMDDDVIGGTHPHILPCFV
jgi:hypothetical protein